MPATLDVIDNDEMLGRGFFNVQQAADSQAGVTSGGSPGDQSQFSMRGFTGNQITTLRNGLYIGPSNMVSRDQNTFNVSSVEILKGPASVLYGQGAVAGALNVVDKAPSFGDPQFEALASAAALVPPTLGSAVRPTSTTPSPYEPTLAGRLLRAMYSTILPTRRRRPLQPYGRLPRRSTCNSRSTGSMTTLPTTTAPRSCLRHSPPSRSAA